MTKEGTGKTMRDARWARWLVLLLLSQVTLIAFLFTDLLSPLKSVLERDLLWDATTFGTYSGSSYFLNVFAGFLVFAGFIVDSLGLRGGTRIAGGIMLLGAWLEFYGLTDTFRASALHGWLGGWWTSMPPTAKMASLGLTLFGCGAAMMAVVVTKALVKWFGEREIATAMSLQMATTRIGMALAAFAGVYIYAWDLLPGAQIAQPVLMGSLLLVLGVAGGWAFCAFDRRLDLELGDREVHRGAPIRLATITQLLRNRAYLLIALFVLIYYMGVFPFQKFAVDMLHHQLGMSEMRVGLIFSLYPIGAALVTPLFGMLLDRRGYGLTMCIVGSGCMMSGHAIFAFLPPGQVGMSLAIVGILLQALSLGLVTASIWPLLPRVVRIENFGTSLSLIFWIENWGLFGGPVAIGRLLDATNLSPAEIRTLERAGQAIPPTNYQPSMLCFVAIGLLATATAAWMWREDRRRGWGMEKRKTAQPGPQARGAHPERLERL
ncbi:MAG: hypothetical protein CSA07_00295 [Bacteroidia bacterium]|nr:MAG: hypothetical protein CSA07_00295 [Bacteroidia bacterium]